MRRTNGIARKGGAELQERIQWRRRRVLLLIPISIDPGVAFLSVS